MPRMPRYTSKGPTTLIPWDEQRELVKVERELTPDQQDDKVVLDALNAAQGRKMTKSQWFQGTGLPHFRFLKAVKRLEQAGKIRNIGPDKTKEREAYDRANAERHKYACPFCRNPDKDHECLEYKRMLAEYSRNKSPLRAGVPWSWVVEHYAAKGEKPPLPREAYE